MIESSNVAKLSTFKTFSVNSVKCLGPPPQCNPTCCIAALVSCCPMGDEFFIDIVFIAGGQTQLLVQDSDHVKDVKIRLKEHCESPNTSFKLLFCGADLPDDRTLYSLGVGPTERGSPCLYCVGMEDVGEVTRTGKNMLSVINLSGGHVALPAGEFDMVGDLKETLTRSLTLPVDRMRLLHRGSELKNETPLSKLTEGLGASSPAPIYVFERPDHSHNVGDRAGGLVNDTDSSSFKSLDFAAIPSGALIERRIDSHWFPAKVFRMHSGEVQRVDIKYLDDGNIELGVDWSECRWLHGG